MGPPGGWLTDTWLPAGGGSPLDIHTPPNPLVFNHTLLGLARTVMATTELEAFQGLLGPCAWPATASAPLQEP